ncbi:MAG: hypothetical protein ACI4OR_00150 [Alphaproteobacteria bacterium]
MQKNLLKVLLLGTALSVVCSVDAGIMTHMVGSDSSASSSLSYATLPPETTFSDTIHVGLGAASPAAEVVKETSSAVSNVSSGASILDTVHIEAVTNLSKGATSGAEVVSKTAYVPGSGGTSVYNPVPIKVSSPISAPVEGAASAAAKATSQATTGAAASATKVASQATTTAANQLTFYSAKDALNYGMEKAGVIGLEGLKDGTTKVLMADGTSYIEHMPIDQVRGAFSNIAGAKILDSEPIADAVAKTAETSAQGLKNVADGAAAALKDFGPYNSMTDAAHATMDKLGVIAMEAKEGGKTLLTLKDGTQKLVDKSISDLTQNYARQAVEAVTKEFSDWAAQRAGELANKFADEVFAGLSGSGEITEIQKAFTDQLTNKISEQLTKDAAEKYGEEFAKKQAEEIAKQAREKAAAKAKELVKVMTNNVAQYALLIWEAIKANEIDDATKEVTVKGAEPMQDSQGSQSSGAATTSGSGTAMDATTIAGAANALNTLLNMGKIDLSLLSTDMQEEEQQPVKEAVQASAGKSSANVDASGQNPTQTTKQETLTTQEQREIMRRRALLLGEWATAAAQIGEGSNAISNAFYDRAAGFAAAANAAQGSLGGITAITDTDRFVLFEITRGAALSSIQLGLQGAANLNDLEEVAPSSDTPPKDSVSIGGAKPQ